MNHQESFIHYLKYEKRDSSHTVVAYENDLNQFVQFGAEKADHFDITQTDRKLVREWVVQLMEKKLQGRYTGKSPHFRRFLSISLKWN
jgi:integrase/recombinase XerC